MAKNKKAESRPHVGIRIDPDLKFNLTEKAKESNLNLTETIEKGLWFFIKSDPPKLDNFMLKDERFDIIKEYTQKIQESFISHMGNRSGENMRELLDTYLSLIDTDQQQQTH